MQLEALIQRYQQERIASSYLVTPHPMSQAPKEDLRVWFKSLLQGVLKQHQLSPELWKEHPDVMLLTDEDFQGKARQETLKRPLSFSDLSTTELRRKFIIVEDVQQLKEIGANKWLKLVESPGEKTVMLFGNPTRAKVLQTLKSRCLGLYLPLNGQQKHPLRPTQGSTSPQQKWSQASEALNSEDEFLSQLIQQESQTSGDYLKKALFLADLQKIHQSRLYNNSRKERIYRALRAQSPIFN